MNELRHHKVTPQQPVEVYDGEMATALISNSGPAGATVTADAGPPAPLPSGDWALFTGRKISVASAAGTGIRVVSGLKPK